VTVTPLRQRRLDVGLLFRHFLDHHSGGRSPEIDPRLLECLLTYDWPGNVRPGCTPTPTGGGRPWDNPGDVPWDTHPFPRDLTADRAAERWRRDCSLERESP